MPEAQVSKATLLLDEGWGEGLKRKEKGEIERRRQIFLSSVQGRRAAAGSGAESLPGGLLLGTGNLPWA